MGFCPSEDLLQKILPAILLSLVVASVVIPLAGCIAHAPDNGGGGSTPLLVTVTSSPASPANIILSTATAPSTVQYTATVTGTSNQAVTWTLAADTTATTVCTATGTALGTMAVTGTSTMTYTAPLPTTPLPVSPCSIVVTATANEDNTTSAQVRLNLHVIVSINPAPDTIGQGGNLQYTATVTGAPATSAGQSIQWSATNGGGFVPAADTTLASSDGIFIAPPLSQGVTTIAATVTATSVFDQTQLASVPVTVVQYDPLGTVSNVQTLDSSLCPTAPDGTLGSATCYSMTVTCPGVADWTATYLKVNTPALNPPAGTVLFTVGQGGANLYDTEYTYGSTTVGNILAANYTTVQVSFGAPFDGGANPNGWLTGPGGPRRLACRYATVANWVNGNPQTINKNATTGAPLCATGNGTGADAIAYGVSEYGLNAIFKMIELTSGPLLTEVDQGCICSTENNGPQGAPCNSAPAPLCYSTSGKASLDAAYSQSSVCSSGNPNNTLLLTSDSIFYQRGKGAVFPLPTTNLDMKFGALDTGAGEPQGWAWNKVVLQNTPTQSCEPNAGHELPNDPTSAADIATSIADSVVGQCK